MGGFDCRRRWSFGGWAFDDVVCGVHAGSDVAAGFLGFRPGSTTIGNTGLITTAGQNADAITTFNSAADGGSLAIINSGTITATGLRGRGIHVADRLRRRGRRPCRQ